jgi:hypothetical protein
VPLGREGFIFVITFYAVAACRKDSFKLRLIIQHNSAMAVVYKA